MPDELITRIKLRKGIIVALLIIIAAGVTVISIIGQWPWHWVLAGSLLGLLIWLKLASVIYPVRKIIKRMLAEEEKKKSAPKGM